MRKIFSYVLSSFLLVLSFNANAYFKLRGDAWNFFNEGEKIVYINGLMDGLYFLNDKTKNNFIVEGVSYKVYIQKLNQFYLAPENKALPIILGVEYITAELRGASQESLDAKINEMRKVFPIKS
ncbi:hypothetical protein VST7929_03196 [Vibrio stylophorae]|uniref:Uncharacterized protein n=1 Tax=Vibrio stylophorae TaxID=659351 RepID=A0ABM8ZY24_9VIBR|nr:hypothetical protein [Vibrio stylophorae]CAH0535722.1 hypothetical protein VST7929_03196 [Vibrio stylophorae]